MAGEDDESEPVLATIKLQVQHAQVILMIMIRERFIKKKRKKKTNKN